MDNAPIATAEFFAGRRAVDLATRALRAYADAGEPSAEEHREVQRWLKKHSRAN